MRGEFRLHRILDSRDTTQIHAGIIRKVGFEQCHPGPLGIFNKQWQGDEGSWFDPVKAHAKIIGLVAGSVTAETQRVSESVTSEIEARIFRRDRELFQILLTREKISKRDAFVVSPEDQVNSAAGRAPLAERDGKLIVMIAHLAESAEAVFPLRVVRLPVNAHDLQVAIQRACILEIQTQRRITKDSRSFIRNTVISPLSGEIGLGVLLEFESNHEVAIRRAQFKRLAGESCARGCKHEARNCKLDDEASEYPKHVRFLRDRRITPRTCDPTER